jgi:hypothetical protein
MDWWILWSKQERSGPYKGQVKLGCFAWTEKVEKLEQDNLI